MERESHADRQYWTTSEVQDPAVSIILGSEPVFLGTVCSSMWWSMQPMTQSSKPRVAKGPSSLLWSVRIRRVLSGESSSRPFGSNPAGGTASRSSNVIRCEGSILACGSRANSSGLILISALGMLSNGIHSGGYCDGGVCLLTDGFVRGVEIAFDLTNAKRIAEVMLSRSQDSLPDTSVTRC